MRRLSPIFFVLTTSCSAPEIGDLPTSVTPPPGAGSVRNRPPTPPVKSPAELAGRPLAQASPRPEPTVTAPITPQAPPTTLVSTPETGLGAAPYTAWTTHAPLTPVGPGGVAVTHIRRLGVRIEVVQVLKHRSRFHCTGCTGDAEGAEAWLQPGRLRAAGTSGAPEDPLVVALQIRARWAGGADLPAGATPGQMCSLIDTGFTMTEPGTAVWESDGGRLALEWTDGRWHIASVRAPRSSIDCRTQRAPAG